MSQVLANRPPSLIHKHLHNICISQAFTLLLKIITRQIAGNYVLYTTFFYPVCHLAKTSLPISVHVEISRLILFCFRHQRFEIGCFISVKCHFPHQHRSTFDDKIEESSRGSSNQVCFLKQLIYKQQKWRAFSFTKKNQSFVYC